MLKTYYTFTVVRDPIERVLSAYRDKAFDEFRGGIGRGLKDNGELGGSIFLYKKDTLCKGEDEPYQ